MGSGEFAADMQQRADKNGEDVYVMKYHEQLLKTHTGSAASLLICVANLESHHGCIGCYPIS